MFRKQHDFQKGNKRGQSTIIDLFTGLFVFVFILIAVILLFNFYSKKLQEEVFREELRDKTFMTTEILLSTGKPLDWNASRVEILGLANYDKHITQGRFFQLRNLSYSKTKTLLGLDGFDFYIKLIKLDGEFIGGYGLDIDLSGKDVVDLRRVIFYDNEVSEMEVRVWRGHATEQCSCTIGERRCNGNDIEECNGVYPACWVFVQTCTGGCQQSGSSASCVE